MLKDAEFLRFLGIAEAVLGGICLLLSGIPGLSGVMSALAFIFAVLFVVLYFWAAPDSKKKAEQLQQEYEDLIHKCMEYTPNR